MDGIDPQPSGTVTALLLNCRQGVHGAGDLLWSHIYAELRLEAAKLLSNSGRIGLLQPTAIVNAAYERLLGRGPIDAENRRHLFFLLGRAMHDILVEHVKAELSQKRGGGRQRVPLFDLPDEATGVWTVDLSELRDALEDLSRISMDSSHAVVLKYFGGRSLRETAELMDCSLSRVREHLDYARAWLLDRLDRDRTSQKA